MNVAARLYDCNNMGEILVGGRIEREEAEVSRGNLSTVENDNKDSSSWRRKVRGT